MDWNNNITTIIITVIIFIAVFLVLGIILGSDPGFIVAIVVTLITAVVVATYVCWDDLFSESQSTPAEVHKPAFYPMINYGTGGVIEQSKKYTTSINTNSSYSIESHGDGRVSIVMTTKHIDENRLSSSRQTLYDIAAIRIIDDHLVRLNTQKSKSILIHLGDQITKTILIANDVYQFKSDSTYVKVQSLGSKVDQEVSHISPMSNSVIPEEVPIEADKEAQRLPIATQEVELDQ